MAIFDKFTKKNEAPTLNPSEVLPTILEALSREGFRPERDNEIRIVYKNEGVFCCFYYREDDPEFLLVRATFERAAFDDVHEAFLYKACAKTDFDQKVSKAYVDEDGDIVFSVESFIMPGTPIDTLALRMSDALASTVAFFHRTLKQLIEDYEQEGDEELEASTPLLPSGGLPS
jgi:hypothetical protein